MAESNNGGKSVKEPIAVVGIGCKLPGVANNPEKVWEILTEGKCIIDKVPASRWDVDAMYDPDASVKGKMNSKYGGFLDDHELADFDPYFFGIAPVAAEKMDIQHRWMLEVCYRAVEDSGHSIDELSGKDVAVVFGVSTKEYGDLVMNQGVREIIDGNSILGTSSCILSNRVSFSFNLKGPSLSIDTACSSSIVGLHIACRGIWSGEFGSALVGGVNSMITPEVSLAFSTGGYLSPDGLCRAFDHRANGYVRSEGAAVVYLKPLSQALKDGDRIYSTIIGTAVNQDGATPGIAYPNRESQMEAIIKACENAHINPDDIQYVEAHGTGTSIGDKVEATSVGMAVGSRKQDNEKLYIGSVKTNFGHLEPASGMAGLTKLVLSMKNGKIPANLHLEKLNPEIPFDDYNLVVPQALTEWKAKDGKRFAGLNSFGFGGTNAHAIFMFNESWDAEKKKSADTKDNYLFTISAKNKKALQEQTENMISYLDKEAAKHDFGDICYSSTIRRSHFTNRVAVVASSREELLKELSAYKDGEPSNSVVSGKCSSAIENALDPAFFFSGQGPQWWGMARTLYNTQPVFKTKLKEFEKILSGLVEWSLTEELLKGEADSLMHTEISQPILLAVQIALAEYWISLGIKPGAVVGHSIGEVSAAYVAGIITLEEAFKIVVYRMEILKRISSKGTMLAVGVSEKEAGAIIKNYADTVEIGTINGLNLVTLTGVQASLEEIAASLDEKDVFYRFLKVTGPFHSRFLDPYKDEILDLLKDIKPKKEKIPVYSSVTGKREENLERDAQYWFRNLRSVVRFTDAVETCIRDGYSVFIEMNVHPILSNYVTEIFEKQQVEGIVVPSLNRKENDNFVIKKSLAALYCQGYPLDWKKLFDMDSHEFVKLPEYPFQRERYWFEVSRRQNKRLGKRIHPFINEHIEFARFNGDHLWEVNFDKRLIPFIGEHVVEGDIVFPAAGYGELALGCGYNAFGDDFGFIEDITFQKGLYLPSGEEELPDIQFNLSGEDGCFYVLSKEKEPDSKWVKHCTGFLRRQSEYFESDILDMEKLRSTFREDEEIDFKEVYQQVYNNGLMLGPTFQSIEKAWYKKDGKFEGEVWGEIIAKEGIYVDLERFNLHPAIWDCAWQLFLPVVTELTGEEGLLGLPVHVDRIKHYKTPGKKVYGYARLLTFTPTLSKGNVWVFNEDGECCLEIQGFSIAKIKGKKRDLQQSLESSIYTLSWEEEQESEKEAVDLKVPDYLDWDAVWLVFRDDKGFADKIVQTLRKLDEKVFTIDKADEFLSENNAFSIVPGDPGHYKQMADYLGEKGLNIKGIIHLWNLDNPDNASLSAQSLELSLAPGSMSLLYSFKELTTLIKNGKSHVWTVTSGAGAIKPNEITDDVALSQSPAVGVMRVAMHEFLDVGSTLIDLNPNPTKKDMDLLIKEILNDEPVEEVAFRQNARYLSRFVKTTQETDFLLSVKEYAGSAQPYEMVKKLIGSIEKIILQKKQLPAVSDDEVCLEVCAAGLNSKDVAVVYRNDVAQYSSTGYTGQSLGMECAGQIISKGKKVKEFKVGDRAFAICPSAFSSHVVVNSEFLFKVPEDVKLTNTAALPVNYLIAGYSVLKASALGKGDAILIKGSTIGSMIPVVMLARKKGATVISYIESEADESIMKQAGADYVISSYNQLSSVIGDKEIDVLVNLGVNGLSSRDFEILGKYGTVVEFCKKNVVSNNRLALLPFKNNLTFSIVDVDELLKDQPGNCRDLISKVISLIGFDACSDKYISEYHISDYENALLSAKSEELKKLILLFNSSQPVHLAPYESFDKFLDREATYIVTGGFSGIGLHYAKNLSLQGVKSLILIGRSGASTDKAKDAVKQMKENGTKVLEMKADITDMEILKEKFSDVEGKIPPVKGLIHCAVVFDDAMIRDMSEERFLKSVKPKAIGAWNMHSLTKDMDLDFFLMLSSVSSEYGNAGQSNYAAGNVFADMLAYHRKLNGLAATTICFGAIGGIGYIADVAQNNKVAKMLEQQGWRFMLPEEVVYITENLILQGHAHRMAMDLDWNLMGQRNPMDRESHRYGHLIKQFSNQIEDEGNFREKLLEMDVSERREALQEEIAKVLASLIGTSSDFFDRSDNILNLGIDSLMVNQIRNWIIANLRIDYPMMKLMKGLSITELANQLIYLLENPDQANMNDGASDLNDAFLAPIPPADEADDYPVSSAQKRLLILNQFDGNNIAYNISTAVIINGSFDSQKGLAAFHKLIEHYDVLRTSFHVEEGEFRQKVHEKIENIEVVLMEGDEKDAKEKVEQFIRPFDFTKAPLCRALIMKLDVERFLFVIDIHHTLIDGTAGTLLLQNFFRLYAGDELETERISYRDYAVWQQNLLDSEIMKRQEEFWLDQFKGDIPVLDLRTDFPRGKTQSFEGDDVLFSVDPEITKSLKDICSNSHTTLYMVLLSAYYILLNKYTGQEDIIIGMPILARRHPDLERLMGMLVNTLALRTYPRGDLSYLDFLEEVKDVAISAYDNQDYPFEELVEKLDVHRDFSRNPLFDVSFNYQYGDAFAFENVFAENPDGAHSSFKGVEKFEFQPKKSGFDITMSGHEADDKILFNISYCTKLYKRETIDRLIKHFKIILKEIVADPKKQINDISLITEEERQAILGNFDSASLGSTNE